jgi:hypothetical protein
LGEGADSGNEFIEALIGGAILCRKLAGLLGKVPDGDAEFGDIASILNRGAGKLIQLALGVTPEGLIFFAIFATLFGEGGGNVLDAIEAFVVSHGGSLDFLL